MPIPDHTQVTLTAGNAFLRDQYDQCVRLIAEALPATTLINLQLLFMSLLRTGNLTAIQRGQQELLAGIEKYPWESLLLKITFGKVSVDEALAVASDEDQRCEVLYYAGERSITDRDLISAIKHFEACASSNSQSIERRFAEIELQKLAPHRPLIELQSEIAGLAAQFTRLKEDGRLQEAVLVAQRCWEIANQKLDNDAPLYFTALQNICVAYHLVHDFSSAIPLVQHAITLSRVSKNIPLLDNYLAALGSMLIETGQHGSALDPLKELVELRKVHVGEHADDYARAVHNLAFAHQRLGNLDEAMELVDIAQRVKRDNMGTSTAEYAAGLSLVGAIFLERRDYPNAERVLLEALEIHRNSGNDEKYVQTLQNLSEVAYRAGRLDEASARTEEARSALSTLGDSHPELVVANLHAISTNLLRKGQFDSAFQKLQSVLELAEKRFGPLHPHVTSVLQALVVAAAGTGRRDAAFMAVQRMLSAGQSRLQQLVLGASTDARRRAVKDLRLEAEYLISIISQCFAADKDAGWLVWQILVSRKGLEGQIERLIKNIMETGPTELIREWVAAREDLYRLNMNGPGVSTHEEGASADRDKTGEHYNRFIKAVMTAARRRSAVELELARVLPREHLTLPGANPREIAQRIPEGCALLELARIRHYDLKGVSGRSSTAYVAVVATHQGIEPKLLDLGEATEIDSLIEAYRSVVAGQEITRASSELISAVLGGSDEKVLDAIGRQLRERIIEPLLRFIGPCRKLLVAPDGDINELPLSALPAVDGKPLIMSYCISYLSTSRQLLSSSTTIREDAGPAAIFAAPNYDLGSESRRESEGHGLSTEGRTSPIGDQETALSDEEALEGLERTALVAEMADVRFTPLEGAVKEAELVGLKLGVAPMVGDAALKGVIKRLQSPRILHIATHGFFLQNRTFETAEALGITITIAAEDAIGGRFQGVRLHNPFLRSGLAFAGANVWLAFKAPPEEAEDGLLTADDIARMNLANTELVVVSACDTGIGQVRNLEGVLGMRQAFEVAGARGLIVSLWRIPDKATEELMAEFYCNLLDRRLETAEALRQAQISLMGRYSQPRMWAGLIFQGRSLLQ